MAYHPFRNPGLKLVSVMLAALLWLTVSRDQVVERSVRVPLEFQNIPEGIEIVGDPPVTVDVRVRGPSNVLGRIDAGEIVAVLDLRAARVGQRLFHLLNDQVRAPFGVQIAQISPPTVSLMFERSAAKVVPIVPAVEGVPAEGFVAGKVTTIPATVEVIGPESRLRRLTNATTEPITIQDVTRPVRDVVTVGVADASVRLREARTALVTVEIRAASAERTVAGVTVSLRNPPRGRRASATPPVVRVTVNGPGDLVKSLEGQSLEAFVDLSGLRPGRHLVEVHVANIAGNVDVVRVEPAKLQVRIQ